MIVPFAVEPAPATEAMPTAATAAPTAIEIMRAYTHPPFVDDQPLVSAGRRCHQTSESDRCPFSRMVERRCGQLGAHS